VEKNYNVEMVPNFRITCKAVMQKTSLLTRRARNIYCIKEVYLLRGFEKQYGKEKGD
jgi:hypothetical protein